ncbi:MAG: hypothetical protein RIS35_2202 [Pseudomonadota bacterium]
MSPPKLRVARTDLWIDPAFDARLAEAPGVSVDVVAARGDPDAARATLLDAHVYHVSAAKD